MSRIDASGASAPWKAQTPEEGRAAARNAVGTLTANVRFAEMEGEPIRSVCVTATTSGEGTSTMACCLAEALAAQGGRVLLVEGNLRQPALAGMLGVRPQAGVLSVMAGTATLEGVAVPTRTEGLSFLGFEGGDADPVDVLSSARFRELLESAERAFDHVVVDTPPVGAYVDGAVVASLADATVLVVRHDRVRRDAVVASVEQLRRAHANLIGTVYTFCELGR